MDVEPADAGAVTWATTPEPLASLPSSRLAPWSLAAAIREVY